ncbi:MAG: hypothetical protein ACXW5U_16420 [Thermoanaerobaculia bacterium]
MPGPYTVALRGIKRGREPEEVFGLAFADNNAQNAVLATYVGHPENCTSCLNVAAGFTDVVALGHGPTHHNGPALTAAAIAINARNSVLHIVYGDHAMVLIAGASHVESLEAWAGRAHGTPNAVIVQSFDDCLFHRADEISITHAQAVTAIGNLLDANAVTRAAAWDTISRASLNGFESGRGIRNLAITIRPLATPGGAAGAMRARIDTAKRWAAIALWGVNQRMACWECLKVHGPTAGGVFGQWHECPNLGCGAMYCDWCGDQLGWSSVFRRTRRCRICNSETELTAGP